MPSTKIDSGNESFKTSHLDYFRFENWKQVQLSQDGHHLLKGIGMDVSH